ncbi:SDR family NAD(P)-dependent oxidoreductase [Micromonospora craniellae]|uniref:SDR family oxidoreductase n=1 Tax=Micromonospora craniellae TaxID=2294034 RepID=A0A372G4M3_9ACTN|nr:SDR family oxidoreductase [Micromonospora craniellae]QOC92993.1 SDR family oxidoreductase [Micromonospora craniellae]RFS47928.1 SDR family oxidoreductase [Micromonospora craniellae]
MTSSENPSVSGGGRVPATVLVTGAASGIGLACARRLTAEGHRVALVDRDGDGLAAASRACGTRGVSVHRAELTDPARVTAVVAEALAAHGDLSGVVNAAGAVRAGSVVDTTDEDWRWNLDTNVSTAFHVCRAVLPHLVARGGGAVVTVASLTALRPIPLRAGYAAAKGAVIAFTRQLALEYGPYGVTANTVCPGAIRTPLLAARLDREPAVEAELTGRVPLRRVGEPAELAGLVHLLVTGGCDYLTGQTLTVDGGLSLV